MRLHSSPRWEGPTWPSSLKSLLSDHWLCWMNLAVTTPGFLGSLALERLAGGSGSCSCLLHKSCSTPWRQFANQNYFISQWQRLTGVRCGGEGKAYTFWKHDFSLGSLSFHPGVCQLWLCFWGNYAWFYPPRKEMLALCSSLPQRVYLQPLF